VFSAGLSLQLRRQPHDEGSLATGRAWNTSWGHGDSRVLSHLGIMENKTEGGKKEKKMRQH